MSQEPQPEATNRAERCDRGQLVLLAAAALALALVPLVLAYLQLGYHDDLHTGSGATPGEVERVLHRGLDDAAADIAFEYSWHERAAATDTVRDRLTSTLDAISRTGLDRGTAYTVRFNQTRAAALASDRCPGGSDRQFGPCIADSGVIIQERQDRAHVLGAAFDIEITTPDREVRVTTAVELPSK